MKKIKPPKKRFFIKDRVTGKTSMKSYFELILPFIYGFTAGCVFYYIIFEILNL